MDCSTNLGNILSAEPAKNDKGQIQKTPLQRVEVKKMGSAHLFMCFQSSTETLPFWKRTTVARLVYACRGVSVFSSRGEKQKVWQDCTSF